MDFGPRHRDRPVNQWRNRRTDDESWLSGVVEYSVNDDVGRLMAIAEMPLPQEVNARVADMAAVRPFRVRLGNPNGTPAERMRRAQRGAAMSLVYEPEGRNRENGTIPFRVWDERRGFNSIGPESLRRGRVLWYRDGNTNDYTGVPVRQALNDAAGATRAEQRRNMWSEGRRIARRYRDLRRLHFEQMRQRALRKRKRAAITAAAAAARSRG